MAANLEDQLIDKERALPPNKQQEALRLLDTLAHGTPEAMRGAVNRLRGTPARVVEFRAAG